MSHRDAFTRLKTAVSKKPQAALNKVQIKSIIFDEIRSEACGVYRGFVWG